VESDKSLENLFTKTYPLNKDIEDVLIKVCSLNAIYSTNIHFHLPFINFAKHIVDLDIDQRLANKDIELVNDIAEVQVNGGETRKLYSFATKYCSHHFPEVYSMYDRYVETMLWHFKQVDNFHEFKKVDLKKDYKKYHTVLGKFIKFYGLQDFTLKEIDIYLWQAGKDHFLKQY
jgi:hypothetical protein